MERKMKKLLLILLCLPFISLSQIEEFGYKVKKDGYYKRTMSISQLTQELEQAANKGIDYELLSCKITYDSINDKKIFINKKDGYFWDVLIKDIHFPDTSIVTIRDCGFAKEWWGEPPYLSRGITFKNCEFGKLSINNPEWDNLTFDSVSIYHLDVFQDTIQEFVITNSNINYLRYYNSFDNIDKGISYTRVCKISNNNIQHCSINNINRIWIKDNTFSYLQVRGKIAAMSLKNNTFNATFNVCGQIMQGNDKNLFRLSNQAGCSISGKDILRLYCSNNNFNDMDPGLKTDSLIRIIKNLPYAPGRSVYWNDNDTSQFNRIIRMPGQWERIRKTRKNIPKEQIVLLEKYIRLNDLLEIKYTHTSKMSISSANIKSLYLDGDTSSIITITNNTIREKLSIKNLGIKSYFDFSNNTLPDYHRVNLDKICIEKLGFKEDEKVYYGNESYTEIEEGIKSEMYITQLEELTSQLKQFISIFNANGSSISGDAIYKLKNLQTTKRMCEYYEDPNIENWFNWKGSEFLKWYSDYGMNPFKALSYCFKAMLWFALFYFFFYSDWDKIDRRFLIKRFNSVMDYFTTEKRIQDFYSSTHDKEMTTFTEFKKTLDKNKIYMPTMLGTLAKPIYQISLLRYKLLNFSYKRAEFMAGRKWVDLKKKDRYLIGTLTFFLTIFYIIYLIIVRALNSIVLSINAFSTLGFGQIPVRGFTKYVAIIEGFIGWFMLSVFIVSLLSQMMSV